MNKIILSLVLFVTSLSGFAQGTVVDEIIAVVGDHIVLHSEVEARVVEAKSQGIPATDQLRCAIIEDLLFQKLLLHKADLDSIEIPDAQVTGELERRMAYFINQFGSEDGLEEVYGKSIEEIKDELFNLLQDQMRAQQVQQSITADVKVTPSEVRAFFNSIPVDSLPLISSQVEVAHIVKRPEVSEEARQMVIEKMNKIRQEILDGASFRTKATLYSEDGSAKDGGDLGFMHCNDLVPEYCAASLELEVNGLSEIVETEYGFHLIQLIERRGELIHTRHILMKPKVLSSELETSLDDLERIKKEIETDTLTFEKAAQEYSDDENTAKSNGILQNPATGSTSFDMEQVDRQLFFVIDKLEEGEISDPVLYQGPQGEAYRIVKLNRRTMPHRANLKDDYQLLQNMTTQIKRAETMNNWIKSMVGNTYVSLDEKYRSCEFQHNWLKVN